MSALPPIRNPSRLERLWEVVSDLLIVAAFIYTLPLLAYVGLLLVRVLTA